MTSASVAPTADAVLVARGVDHAVLARRTRRWGWWLATERRFRTEVPFLHSTLLTALGNPLAYLAAMGIGLGSLVSQRIDGVSYLTFVAPALLVSTVATTGAGWGTWPIMSGFKWEKGYLAASASPLSPAHLFWGEFAALAVRLLAQGLVFWLIGLPFGAWPGGASLLAVGWGALAGLAFFAPLAAYAATLDGEGIQFNFINRLVIMPMFLFAGTFFPLESLPVFLQWIGWISPMWHGTQLARVASYGLVEPGWLVAAHLAFLGALALGGGWVAARMFTRRLTR